MKVHPVRRFGGVIKNEEGGIALESALFFPLVVSFMLAFIACMHLFLAEMALQSAASETVKQISQHMYAVKVIKDSGLGSAVQEKLGKVTDSIDYVEDTILEAAEYVPEPMQAVLGLFDAAKEQKERWIKDGAGYALKPLLLRHLQGKVVDPDRVRITDVEFPWIMANNDAFIGLTAECEVRIKLPYFSKTVNIQVKAYERAWIGGI